MILKVSSIININGFSLIKESEEGSASVSDVTGARPMPKVVRARDSSENKPRERATERRTTCSEKKGDALCV